MRPAQRRRAAVAVAATVCVATATPAPAGPPDFTDPELGAFAVAGAGPAMFTLADPASGLSGLGVLTRDGTLTRTASSVEAIARTRGGLVGIWRESDGIHYGALAADGSVPEPVHVPLEDESGVVAVTAGGGDLFLAADVGRDVALLRVSAASPAPVAQRVRVSGVSPEAIRLVTMADGAVWIVTRGFAGAIHAARVPATGAPAAPVRLFTASENVWWRAVEGLRSDGAGGAVVLVRSQFGPPSAGEAPRRVLVRISPRGRVTRRLVRSPRGDSGSTAVLAGVRRRQAVVIHDDGAPRRHIYRTRVPLGARGNRSRHVLTAGALGDYLPGRRPWLLYTRGDVLQLRVGSSRPLRLAREAWGHYLEHRGGVTYVSWWKDSRECGGQGSDAYVAVVREGRVSEPEVAGRCVEE